jgi:hypothetical protein
MLRWPLPALIAWLLAWSVYVLLTQFHGPPIWAFIAATCSMAWPAWRLTHQWRRLIVLAGFPLSYLLLHGPDLPAWAWPVMLGLLLVLYPLRSWRDAPLFPTPSRALEGLSQIAPLPAGARILEAGCGLGHGLRALHGEYPQARLIGIEWSLPLSWFCRWRCRVFATIKRADMWREDWSDCAMIYLFQRPETMSRAVAKARDSLRPGAWLISLEFEATDLKPHACLESVEGKPVWVYLAPFRKR